MFRLGKILAVGAALLCIGFVGIARADDDMIDNPAYQSWAKFKEGTIVKYSTDSEAMGNKTSMISTQTLKTLAPDKATIETKMSMVVAGNTTDMPPSSTDIPAKIKKASDAAAAPADAPKAETGTADVKIGDKTYSCKTSKVTTDSNGMKATVTTWMCDDVPGGLVQMETETTGAMTANVKMTLLEVDAK